MDFPNNTVWQADWDSFGTLTVTINTVENNLRFPGQYYDSETGFYYNFHRYYSPEIGRYLREDEVRSKWDFNLYVYVGGNPVMNVDNNGWFSWRDWWNEFSCFKYWWDAASCAAGCDKEWKKCIAEEERKPHNIGEGPTICCVEKWKKKYGIRRNMAGDAAFNMKLACYEECMKGKGKGALKCAPFLKGAAFAAAAMLP